MKTVTPDFETFQQLAERPDVDIVPISRRLIVDMESPLAIFQKIADGPNSFLLESVEGGEKWARYCFMASNPRMVFRSEGNHVTLIENDGRTQVYPVKNPLEELRRLLGQNRSAPHPDLRFTGGAVGYLGYDMVRFMERLPDVNPKTINTPDSVFLFTDTLVAYDNMASQVIGIANVRINDYINIRQAYEAGMEKIDLLAERLRMPIDPKLVKLRRSEKADFVSNVEPSEYESGVQKAKEYIQAGDIFQLVLSQRFTIQEPIRAFDLYRALRITNPSPYMFYLDCGSFQLVGSSPEVLVRLEDGDIAIRPIAGTRRRGRTDEEDKALEREMLDDPKECAEHVMLVDLGRNDVGRVSKAGSVKVDEMMVVERYSQVMHIVSNVTSRLEDDKDAIDLLRATFPAGTLTGAPKIRAMEIIDELESLRRGAYGGAVGYFDFSGNMDFCITIRTFIVEPEAVHVQAGAGVVADSQPALENKECRNKARALFKAVELLSSGKGWA